MYKLIIYNENKPRTKTIERFKTMTEMVEVAKELIRTEVRNAYDWDIVDRYGCEDALWNLEEYFIERHGFDYEDIHWFYLEWEEVK